MKLCVGYLASFTRHNNKSGKVKILLYLLLFQCWTLSFDTERILSDPLEKEHANYFFKAPDRISAEGIRTANTLLRIFPVKPAFQNILICLPDVKQEVRSKRYFTFSESLNFSCVNLVYPLNRSP